MKQRDRAVAAASNTNTAGIALLDVRKLCVSYAAPGGRRRRRVVDRVSLQVPPGRTLALVGESGSGKTTTARAILRLIPADSGRVLFDGRDVLSVHGSQLRALRREMQVVFQDPGGSLNPRLNVEMLIGEGLHVHGLVNSAAERRRVVGEWLERVGLRTDDMRRLPHEFSGGQRQRIAIARALAVRPRLLICDEPVSALDVSVQSQILNLLADLQAQYRLSYLFITHDLAVVRAFADEVSVMKGGRIVEHTDTHTLFAKPQHSYSRRLLAAAPRAPGSAAAM
ncbi:MAG: ATP-binding cassette domain-containing protein [Planctomycetota bacterium]|nr:MAG: ATP-binding cassette domain-containing protein [Planctomycetota bacterium]